MNQSDRTTCALCETVSSLCISHVLPRFVFDWLRRTSPTYIRRTGTPNKRVQDGDKCRLLCADCELRLSTWEKAFAERVFAPYHDILEGPYELPYDSFCLKFCVSVSWRVLYRQKAGGGLRHLSDAQRALADRALTTWRQFLLDQVAHPGTFEQHILPVHLVATANHMPRLSPYINRYFMRSTDHDVVCSDGFSAVYCKLGRILLFGFIQNSASSDWRGSQIHVRDGILRSSALGLPLNVMRHLSDRANISAWAMSQRSQRQSEISSADLRQSSADLLSSEARLAIEQDIRLFGDRAFEDPVAPPPDVRVLEKPPDATRK